MVAHFLFGADLHPRLGQGSPLGTGIFGRARQRIRLRWKTVNKKIPFTQVIKDHFLLTAHHGSTPNRLLKARLMASMWSCYYCQVANSEKALTCKLCRGWWEEVWDQKGETCQVGGAQETRSRSRNRQDKGKEDANYDPLRPFGIKGGKEAKEEEVPWQNTTPAKRITARRADEPTAAEADSYAVKDNTKVMAQLETIRSALGDNPAEEVLAALESLDSSVRKDAGKPAVSEDQALSAAHLYRLLNAKKQMEKAKQKLMDLDTAWKSFQQMVTQRIKEQKDSYLAQRVEAVQVYQQTSPKIARSRERDLKSRTAEAGALSLEDDIDDADLQATLQAATDGDPEFVDVEAMQDVTAGQDAFHPQFEAVRSIQAEYHVTETQNRGNRERRQRKEEGPPKSKGPKK